MSSTEFIDILRSDDPYNFDKWCKLNAFFLSKSCQMCDSTHKHNMYICNKSQRTFYHDLTSKLKLKHEYHHDIGYILVFCNSWNIFYSNLMNFKDSIPYSLIVDKNKYKEYFEKTKDTNILYHVIDSYISYNSYREECECEYDIMWCVQNGYDLNLRRDSYSEESRGEHILRSACVYNKTNIINWLVFDQKIKLSKKYNGFNYIEALFSRGRYDILIRLVRELEIDVKKMCGDIENTKRIMRNNVSVNMFPSGYYDKCLEMLC
jgi:hypothetical protein